MTVLGLSNRREVEVRQYPILIYALVPLAAQSHTGNADGRGIGHL
jgi:hypothetical protein